MLDLSFSAKYRQASLETSTRYLLGTGGSTLPTDNPSRNFLYTDKTRALLQYQWSRPTGPSPRILSCGKRMRSLPCHSLPPLIIQIRKWSSLKSPQPLPHRVTAAAYAVTVLLYKTALLNLVKCF